MKRTFTLLIISFLTIAAQGQNEPFLPDTNALEGIIVEKFYISNEADVAAGLPEGSITYRVYADLKPDYTVLNFTAFSVHPISIRVSDGGEFYNNGLGSTFGVDVNPALFTVDASIGLDSWLTIGGATDDGLGILKSNDEDESSILAGSPLGYLFNDEGYCLPSLQDQDGIIAGEVPSITTLGLDTDQLPIFGTQNSSDNFDVNDITIAVLGGTTGVGEENHVLLGQFTTLNGTLEFDINIQIGIPEELQCNVIPSCEKSSIWFTYSFDPQDSENNQNPNLNYVTYQNESLSYVDDGAPCTLNIEELRKIDNAFSVFPNPTEGFTQLSFSELLENARYEIYDISGKLIKSKNLGLVSPGSVLEIDLKSFESGVYLIKVISKNSYSIKKLVRK
jgi:hypothetical protein